MSLFSDELQDVQHPSDVLLINMPFGILAQPSIGLGLIQAHLKTCRVSCKVLYLTLPFAKTIGISLYKRISNGEPLMVDQVGEWLFSTALFPNDFHSTDSYIDQVLRGNHPAHRSTNPVQIRPISEEFIADILQVQTKIPSFLEACVRYVLQHRPKIVGFTSLFQQHLASLALAQRLKSTDPQIKILFGGANCEGAMGAELVRQFQFVDAAVSGEADLVVKEVIERLLTQKSLDDIQGVYTSTNVKLLVNGIYPNAPSVKAMDSLPYPDYSDYFQQKTALGLDFPVSVLYETSRGCWWGEKHHCTFCGLNGLTMAFRSKSSERALVELIHLKDTYPACSIDLVDNILDMKYFQSFVPRLAALKLDLKLFYEVKANLKKEQIRLLQIAGITRIQPGIESLSTSVLELMNKGVRALQNIQLLKWCKEVGVEPLWNFLWGFPDEDPEEYQRMGELIPLLTHLPPPSSAQRVHLDRFSPMFNNAEHYGLVDVEPYPSYEYIYPALSKPNIMNLAYYFSYEERRNLRDYVMLCAQSIEEWKRVHRTSDLYAMSISNVLLIWDFRPRPISQAVLTRLTGLEREIYLACDAVQSLDRLRALIAQELGSISHQQTQEMLQRFVDRRLMVAEGNSYLSLAVLLADTTPKWTVFVTMLRKMEAVGKMPDYFRVTEMLVPAGAGRY